MIDEEGVMGSTQSAADAWRGQNSANSAASDGPEVPIVVVNELQGIELLACYSDGGANPLA
jgi:hypothetical protein